MHWFRGQGLMGTSHLLCFGSYIYEDIQLIPTFLSIHVVNSLIPYNSNHTISSFSHIPVTSRIQNHVWISKHEVNA